MENNSNNENSSFEYTYNARQQQEIERIRKKYLPKEEDKMETLRRLDKEAERPGLIWSIAAGVIGSLLLGTGMSCVMVFGDSLFVLGIIVGLLGMVVMGIAYPLYIKLTKKQRAKVADRILELSKELSL